MMERVSKCESEEETGEGGRLEAGKELSGKEGGIKSSFNFQ